MWLVSSCAIRGRSHERNDLPCQDKVKSLVEEDFAFSGLADGAGSASLSHFGAESALEFCAQYFKDRFDEMSEADDGVLIKREILCGLVDALSATAQAHGSTLKELASTLLVVAVRKGIVIILHIGDGVIGYRKNGQLHVATSPVNGEYANTTVFTTSANALQQMQLIKAPIKDIDGFVLMSDGTEASCYDKRTRSIARAIDSLMNTQIKHGSQFFSQMLEDSATSSLKKATTDDCSLVLMVKDDPTILPYKRLGSRQKRSLMGLPETGSDIRFNRLDDIVNRLFVNNGMPLKLLAKAIDIKPKHLEKQIKPLLEKGVLMRRGQTLWVTLR